jgi:very-short-patch-repair endonuclease
MEPGLFDLVVVDEATQCTLTNLLPLLYRGQKIAVIGDEDQLKAIPNISSLEEGEIAKKYDVKEWMSLLGHWENNVYKTAVKSLPNRRPDVVMLKDHYRSHPLIIGFSNQHIYGHRLKLLRDPETIKEVPWGAGVHAKHIKGKCERGAGGKSYQNKPEAGEVIALVKALMKENHSSLSIGIVTPFRAQLDLIKERLDEEGLLENITVGVAHTFQGDERDVVIFSLTASRGIKPTGIRFMEEPPNLVNVAVTRAREALFVVGDLDFCRNQKGIIGELIKYCDGIQKIRDAEYTSNEEMALYEWMVLDNIQPEVHQIIGDLEVDFLVKNAGIKLVVEVDGSQHDDQKAEDAARDAFLQARGYDVLRVPTREIQETPAIVMEKIRKALELEDPDYGAE